MISVWSILIPVVMAVLLLGWVIFCAVQFIRHSRDVIVASDFVGHVKCEACGAEYDVSAADFTKSFASRSRSVTRTRMEGAAFVNRPHYSYYAKKFHCPGCGRKRYAQVLNINEINRAMEKPMLRTGMRWLLLMCIGGILILAAAAVPMHFLNQARERQVEELREQRYEELKDRLE